MIERMSLQGIRHYLRLDGNLHTSGQPTAEHLGNLAAEGIRTVINLALPSSDHAVGEEDAILAGQSIRYIHLPVLWESPQKEDFQLFRRLLPLVAGQPVLVHCALNMRVSAFIYLYRRLELGYRHQDAAPDLSRIWAPADQWYLFVNHLLQAAGLPETDFS